MTDRALVLRLAGPAQSWGSAPYAVKATEGVPTRSAILGLIGAAFGAARGELPDWLHDTGILARVDRPGQVVVDLHTIINPPADVGVSRTRQRFAASAGTDKGSAAHTVSKGDGKGWDTNAMITRRAYLADAEFIIAISHPDPEKLDTIAAAFDEPKFMLFLGRKAFAPAFPFNLGVHTGAAHDLLGSLPTSARPGTRLAVHAIEQDKNYAERYVTPDAPASTTELWRGWKAA